MMLTVCFGCLREYQDIYMNKGGIEMSEELREAIETDAYEYIDDDYITRDIDLAREVAYQEIYD